jgi:hypothetical protein
VGWLWWGLCAAVLFCFRWRLVLAPFEFNPDEAHLIAGAMTLRHDPVFWRSVDGITAGPLDFYALLPAAFATGLASFTIERLIGLALTFGMWVFAAKSVALFAGSAVARVAMLPALAFTSLTRSPDFLFYSTELVPLLLISIGVYFLVRQTRHPEPICLWLGSLALGAAPWAKLQAMPMAGAALALGILSEISRGKTSSGSPLAQRCERHLEKTRAQSGVSTLLIGSLIPSLAFTAMATITGQAHHMLVSYWLNNVGFVQASQRTLLEAAKTQWANAAQDGFLGVWTIATTVLCMGVAVVKVWARKFDRRYIVGAIAMSAAALIVVLVPRRDTVHYLHFLELPLILMAGACLATLDIHLPTSRRVWLGLATGLIPQLGWIPHHPGPVYETDPANISRERVALSHTVAGRIKNGEPVAVWGWRSAIYVDTGTIQATREGQTQPQMNGGAWRGYFLERYLEDFRRSNPVLFIDAVGPGNYISDRASSHESFEKLAALVRSRYTFLEEIDHARVYVRNDQPLTSSPNHPIR